MKAEATAVRPFFHGILRGYPTIARLALLGVSHELVECDVPSGSVLGRELIERAYFRDSYRAPLSRREHGIIDIFFGIFAHHPLWMKLLLIIRNKVASLADLDAPTASEILHVEVKDRYAVGEKIGVWPIFALSAFRYS